MNFEKFGFVCFLFFSYILFLVGGRLLCFIEFIFTCIKSGLLILSYIFVGKIYCDEVFEGIECSIMFGYMGGINLIFVEFDIRGIF